MVEALKEYLIRLRSEGKAWDGIAFLIPCSSHDTKSKS